MTEPPRKNLVQPSAALQRPKLSQVNSPKKGKFTFGPLNLMKAKGWPGGPGLGLAGKKCKAMDKKGVVLFELVADSAFVD